MMPKLEQTVCGRLVRRDPDPSAGVPLLTGLSVPERSRIAELCRFQHFAAGRSVIDADAEERDVLFVIDGRIRVVDLTAGGRTVTFAELGPGSVVGELAALDGGPRTAAVRAETDCLVGKLSDRHFNALLERHPAFAAALMCRLVQIIRNADQRISELSTLDACSRLCRELLRRSAPTGADERQRMVDPLPTQEQLASLTGATRESIARLLGRLQHAGTVRRLGHRLIIADPSRMAEIAELHEL